MYAARILRVRSARNSRPAGSCVRASTTASTAREADRGTSRRVTSRPDATRRTVRARRARHRGGNRERAQQEDGPQTAAPCTVRCGAPPVHAYRPQACPEQSRRANERSHATGYEEGFGEASFEGASGGEAPVELIFSGLFFSGLFFSVLFVSAPFLSAPSEDDGFR